MPPHRRAVDPDRLARWCTEYLGSPPVEELFSSGNLSAVRGVRLADGRKVVIKIRPAAPRLAACTEVQRHLHDAGYPGPEPLTAPLPFGHDTAAEVATAEVFFGGGDELPRNDPSRAFAGAFARLIDLAPRPNEVGTLDPPPSWANWNHGGDGLWARSEEEPDVDLNAATGPEWINDAARHARDRLRGGGGAGGDVIGHCDWLAGNLRWDGDELLVVHDWDSVVADDEAVLVGFAAALHPGRSPEEMASVEDTQRFLDAYGVARGRRLSTGELGFAWAAGVWTRAYDAKLQHALGQPVTSLTEHEATERLRRSRADSNSG